MEKVLFLDRDGVINIEKDYLYKIEDFEFIDGVFETLKYAISLGFKIVIVTNQSGISRGYYTNDDFDKLTTWMISQFKKHNITIDGVFYCPHGPNDDCNCRKPKIGMFEQASELFEIDLENSWLVGDKNSDIQMAINAGIKNSVQVESGHHFKKEESLAKFIIPSIKELIMTLSVK